MIITSRDEVLVKVIFSQACVILSTEGGYPSMPCRSVPGGWVSQHALQVSPEGWVGILACLASQSRGRGGLVPGGLQFFGGSPIFQGVSNFSGVSNFLGGGVSNFLGGVWLRGGWGGPPNFFFFFLFLLSLGIHPPLPRPDTGIRSTFGRYASYWNAFLSMILWENVDCHFGRWRISNSEIGVFVHFTEPEVQRKFICEFSSRCYFIFLYLWYKAILYFVNISVSNIFMGPMK